MRKERVKGTDSANGQKRQANERIGEQTRMKQGVRLDERQKRGKLPTGYGGKKGGACAEAA